LSRGEKVVREMEVVEVCNYCGSMEFETYCKREDGSWYGYPLHLIKCTGCGLIVPQLRPLWSSIVEVYGGKPDIGKRLYDKKLKRPWVLTYDKRVINLLLNRNHSAKYLWDIGFGAGTLMREAAKLGLKVYGNDINRYSCDQLLALGFPVQNKPTILTKWDVTFDIVTMMDYIEHSYTPFDDLLHVSSQMNKDAILYLTTVNMDGPMHKKLGVNWHLLGPGHFNYPTLKVLKNMLRDVGLQVQEVSSNKNVVKLVSRKVNDSMTYIKNLRV